MLGAVGPESRCRTVPATSRSDVRPVRDVHPQLALEGAGVCGRFRLDQDEAHLVSGDWSVGDALWAEERLAQPQGHVGDIAARVVHLDG